MQSFQKLIGYLKDKFQAYSQKPIQNQVLSESDSTAQKYEDPKIILKLQELLEEKIDPEKEIHICPECEGELYISHSASNSLSGQRWGIGVQCKDCKIAAHMSLAGDFIPKWLVGDKR